MKKCFKCNIEKGLSEFYTHKQMADGHLNKCIVCTKADVQKRLDEKLKDPLFVQFERRRTRRKYHRLYAGTGNGSVERNVRHINKYPEKRKATQHSQHMKKPFEGAEKHHWSYNAEHYKDVIWLTKKEHMKGHRFIVYDQERMMYRRYDTNELLHTKEVHETFIKHCITHKED